MKNLTIGGDFRGSKLPKTYPKCIGNHWKQAYSSSGHGFTIGVFSCYFTKELHSKLLLIHSESKILNIFNSNEGILLKIEIWRQKIMFYKPKNSRGNNSKIWNRPNLCPPSPGSGRLCGAVTPPSPWPANQLHEIAYPRMQEIQFFQDSFVNSW